MSSTLERFLATRIENGWAARFMALEIKCWRSADGEDEYHESDAPCVTPIAVPVGGKATSTFKTLRNARKAAGPNGFVLVFDPRSLPLVAEEASPHGVDNGQELDEEAFTERQLLYWERMLIEIRARRNA